MNFGNAFIFPVSLALAFITVLGLYLLVPPRRRMVVSSLMIWRKVLPKNQTKLDRKKWLISLILAFLIVSLLLTVILSHNFGNLIGVNNRVAIVLDNSPSMQALGKDGNARFENAKSEARKIISRLDINSKVMVLDSQGTIISPKFDTAKDGLELIDTLSIGRNKNPERFVMSILEEANYGTTSYLITDGVSLPKPNRSWIIKSVYSRAHNLGITRFRIDSVPGKPLIQKAFITIKNESDEVKSGKLRIFGAGSNQKELEFEIDPDSELSRLFDISDFDDGPITARINSTNDALPFDNVAYSYRASSKLIKIGLVSDDPRYLEPLLTQYPSAVVEKYSSRNFKYEGNIDFYVFDRYLPAAPPTVPSLVFSSSGSPWLPKGQKIIDPKFSVVYETHPLLDNVSFDDVFVDSATAIGVSDSRQQSLLDVNSNSSILMIQDKGPKLVWVGFSLDESNFAINSSFPVFLDNVLTWSVNQSLSYRYGLGPVKTKFTGGSIIGPAGVSVPSDLTTNGNYQFIADVPGIYTLKNEFDKMKIIVNVFGDKLTNVNGGWLTLPPSQRADEDSKFELLSNITSNPILFLLWLSLFLLTLEWVTYNLRRTV